MDSQKVVVVVEEAEEARTALEWAIRNFIRGGDSIMLLHVYPPSRSLKRQKSFRVKGFHLALSFKELCNGIAEAKVEILVKEGEIGTNVATVINRIGASTLVVGLHDQSFLYNRSNASLIARIDCRILAVSRMHSTTKDCFATLQLSQIQIITLRMSEPRIPYPFLQCPIWRLRRRRRARRRE